MSFRVEHGMASGAFPDADTKFYPWCGPSPSGCFPLAQRQTLGAGVETSQSAAGAAPEVGQDRSGLRSIIQAH